MKNIEEYIDKFNIPPEDREVVKRFLEFGVPDFVSEPLLKEYHNIDRNQFAQIVSKFQTKMKMIETKNKIANLECQAAIKDYQIKSESIKDNKDADLLVENVDW